MADETPQTGETPTDEVQPRPEVLTAEMVENMRAELDRVQKALKDANRESAGRRKRLEELEQAEQTRKDQELSELEKLQKKYQETEAKAAKLEREALQRAAAEKIGLPLAFANRIQGETPEEMAEDAKALLEAMPKPAPAKAPALSPTNPGSGAAVGETDEQKRARIYRQGSGLLWNPDNARANGGGVIWNPSTDPKE
jgi:septal ring factor EnvC (AmiA/AmiB activator)